MHIISCEKLDLKQKFDFLNRKIYFDGKVVGTNISIKLNFRENHNAKAVISLKNIIFLLNSI